MKTLQIRVADDLRDEADAVLQQLGMDLPTAVRVYLAQIVQTKGIPFAIGMSSNAVSEEEFSATSLEQDLATRQWLELAEDRWNALQSGCDEGLSEEAFFRALDDRS